MNNIESVDTGSVSSRGSDPSVGDLAGREVVSLSDSPQSQMMQVANFCFGMNKEKRQVIQEGLVAFPLTSDEDKQWLQEKGEALNQIVTLNDARANAGLAVEKGFDRQEAAQRRCEELTDQISAIQEELKSENADYAERQAAIQDEIAAKNRELGAKESDNWLRGASRTLTTVGNACGPLSAVLGAAAAYSYRECASLVCEAGSNWGVPAAGAGVAFGATQVYQWRRRKTLRDLNQELRRLQDTLGEDKKNHKETLLHWETNMRDSQENLALSGQTLEQARRQTQDHVEVCEKIDDQRREMTVRLVDEIAHLSLNNLRQALEHKNESWAADIGRSSLKIVMNAALAAVGQNPKSTLAIADGKGKARMIGKAYVEEVSDEESLFSKEENDEED